MTDPKQDHKSTRVDCNQPDSSQVLNCMPFTKPSAEGSPFAVIVDSIAMVEPCVARASGVVMAWLLQQVSVRLYIIHDNCTQGVGRWNPTDGNRYPRILNHAAVRPKQPNLVVTLTPVGVYDLHNAIEVWSCVTELRVESQSNIPVVGIRQTLLML